MTAKPTAAKPMLASATLSTLLFAAAAGLAAGVAAEPAETPSATAPSVARDPLFTRLDSNRDGYVDRTEASGLARFIDAFKDADDDRDDRLSADEFVKARAIHDRLRAAAYARDSLITARVKAALVRDPSVSGLDVSVETAYGEVLLSGFVDDEKQARRAREIAAHVSGVRRVHDAMIVRG